MSGLRILSPVQYRRFYSGLAVRRGSAAERGSLWAGVGAERFHRRQDRAAASVQPLPLAQPQEPLVGFGLHGGLSAERIADLSAV